MNVSRPTTGCLASIVFAAACMAHEGKGAEMGTLVLKSKTLLERTSPISRAIYREADGPGMMKVGAVSPDNGLTWTQVPAKPDFDSDLPYGYRRSPHTPWRDPVNGNILLLLNCMDTPEKDPNAVEPRWQWHYYYLRYRVSRDGGRTWLFDDPIVQQGKAYSPGHPLDGVTITRNCFFLGDAGSRPVRTREGTVLVPMQTPPLKPDGDGFTNPGGGWYWLDSRILIGNWQEDGHIVWDVSEPIRGDGDRTSRGLYEPTLAQMPDGSILCVMRGSNGGPRDRNCEWPSHKWAAVSADGGHTWSKPKAWTYADGQPFFSPASMSELFVHSNGCIYWIGNLSGANCRANHPRWPLVIGRVDPGIHGLLRETVVEIDTKQPDEDDVNLSHWHALEDRQTGDIVISTSRAGPGYKTRQPVLYVIGVEK